MPLNALSGHVYARVRGGKKTNAKSLKITKPPHTGPPSAPAKGTAFDGDGQWIWQVPKSDGGDPNAIIARAKAAGIETLFVKSGDGDTYWDQFSPEFVNALHAGGLKVCAWQFVYGDHPNEEAATALRAIHSGADCFVIDAESQYEHNADRYANAATYLSDIRADAQVGTAYPIGLTGFPYVDSHPGFPYSTFLGPGGAQFNLPQIYWQAIGDTVDESVNHTYAFNLPYNRPIVPLGQTYGNPGPPATDLQRFRQLVTAEGSLGLSWWSYQETDDNEWATLAADPGPFPGASAGDRVRRAQEGQQGRPRRVGAAAARRVRSGDRGRRRLRLRNAGRGHELPERPRPAADRHDRHGDVEGTAEVAAVGEDGVGEAGGQVRPACRARRRAGGRRRVVAPRRTTPLN